MEHQVAEFIRQAMTTAASAASTASAIHQIINISSAATLDCKGRPLFHCLWLACVGFVAPEVLNLFVVTNSTNIGIPCSFPSLTFQ